MGFDLWDHPNPYPLECVNDDVEVTKYFLSFFTFLVK